MTTSVRENMTKPVVLRDRDLSTLFFLQNQDAPCGAHR